MSGILGVRDNFKNVKKYTKDIQKVMPRAVAAAANRAGQGARTEATKKVRQTYAVKAGAVNKTFKLTRATPRNLTLQLRSYDKGMPLIEFKVRPSKPVKKQPKVLKAAVHLGNSKNVTGAFVAKLGSRIVVAQRDGAARFPIQELYGPPVPYMLNNEEVKTHIMGQFKIRFDQRLPHEVNRVMGKLGL